MKNYIVYIALTTLLRKIHLFHFLSFGRSFSFDSVLMLFTLFSFFSGLLKQDSDDRARGSFSQSIPSRFVVTLAVEASDTAYLIFCGCNY